jgi:hypothetical protein
MYLSPSISKKAYQIAARAATLSVSTWGAFLGLFVQPSLVSRVHGEYLAIDVLNVVILLGAGLGWVDFVWHDLCGKLLAPKMDARLRHVVCVLLYSFFGASWLVKAFSSLASPVPGSLALALFALTMSLICGSTALAIALEKKR